MDRLICGDVGFGKTEVAMRAAFISIMNNRQVIILVPTTLLASQHYNNFISQRGGIVVSKTGRFKNATYYISVADFGGDYLVLNNNGLTLHKKQMDPVEKLILMNNFGNWWYVMHKSLFQETLVQTII